MKKTTLFFAFAAFIGIGSAVATGMRSIGDEYILNDATGTYELRSSHSTGKCLEGLEPCTYTKVANNGVSPDTNPANFEVKTRGEWVE